MLKLIVWDIAKTLLMECFGNRLDKIPDKVKIIPDPTLGPKKWTNSSLEITQNDSSFKGIKNEKSAGSRGFINNFQILYKKHKFCWKVM